MLQEERLSLENANVCNALLGGLLLHPHIGHMITAKRWASRGNAERLPLGEQLPIEQLTEEEKAHWEAQGQEMCKHLEEL